MRPRLALLLLCLARGAAAQSREEPQLIFSITAGLSAGAGALWTVPQQQVQVNSPSGGLDTLALARYLRPGLTATLLAGLFRSPHVGYMVEAGYFGVGTEERCHNVVPYKPDGENVNEQACTRAQGLNIPTSAVGFQVGLTYRLAPEGSVTPYVRAGAGPAFLGNSFVQTEGLVQATRCGTTDDLCYIPFLTAQSTQEITWLVTLAAGATIAAGSGSRLRFEVRDLIGPLPVPTGPANPTTVVAPVGTRIRHIPTFIAGFDIVLERRRGRRY